MNRFPRWFMAVFALMTLILLAGGALFYRAQERYFRQDAETNLNTIASFKVDQIVQWRAERIGDAAVIMESPFFIEEVTRFLADPRAEATAQMLARFRSLQEHYHYRDILLVDADGKVRLSLSGGLRQLHTEAAQVLASALRDRKPKLSDLHAGPGDLPPHLDVIAPLFTGSGEVSEPIGAVILQSDAKKFLYPLIQSWPTPSQTAESILVRRDGNAVLFLNELRHQQGAGLSLRIPLSQIDVPAVMAVLGREGVVQGKDYRGVEVLSVLKAIPDSPWFMVAKVDAAEALLGWRREVILILALLLGIVAAAAAAMGVVWQGNQKEHYRTLYQAEAARKESEARYKATLLSIGDGVITTDAGGRVVLLNPVAEALTGWRQEDARGKPLEEVFRIVNEETRQTVENPVCRVMREGVVLGLGNHTLLLARDGTERPIDDSGSPIRDENGVGTGVVLVFHDVTRERRYNRERETTVKILGLLNASNRTHELIQSITCFLQEWSGCDAVGVRLKEGDDFPYFETRGFSPEFVRAESYLCERDLDGQLLRDSQGNPVLECMCGNVLCGRFDPALPFFTAQGSFWTNSTTELLSSFTEADRQARTRNRCNGEGYESVALIRLRSGDETLGLLQLNDRAKGRFTPEFIAFLESAADQIAIALAQRLAQAMLRASEDKFRTVADWTYDWEMWSDPQARLLYLSPSVERISGYRVDEYFSDPDLLHRIVFPEDRARWDQHVREWRANTAEIAELDFRILARDGGPRWINHICRPVFGSDGQFLGRRESNRDITERKRAEVEQEKLQSQLQQMLKMESVGRLAGGVAHDFNNMLQVITSYVEIAMMKIDPSQPLHQYLKQIREAAQRAADLTRQLLAFARKQAVNPIVLDLNDTVSGILEMLRRLIGEDIDLVWIPGHELGKVKIDPSQIDQLLANLAVNARDAIAGVGKLTIETDNVVFDKAYCAAHAGFVPGEFVLLAVSDDGCGMDEKTLSHLFEPFFTTKGVGEGTGLGLATMYGIVKQNDGFINVYSEPGHGSTFKIYLPRCKGEVPMASTAILAEATRGGTETLLMVEDEKAILDLGKMMLEELGYTVLTAGTPGAAIRLAEEHVGAIHLLITDVVMPQMNGRDLAKQLSSIQPGLRCLFMSGYTANVIAHRGVLEQGVHFIPKPFSVTALAQKVREALGE